MGKAVLISIQPKWVEKIVNGEKTIEVRKTKPKLETPFKVYIYCTVDKKIEVFFTEEVFADEEGNWAMPHVGNGKVIGEFVCDRIDSWQDHEIHITNLIKLSCVSLNELDKYSKGGKENLYGWHITDLKIYDKPKELSEFEFPKDNIHLSYRKRNQYFKGITRPPQSWCYVEELQND